MAKKKASKESSKTGDLTAKQKSFCEEFIVDLNATQAAVRAGYAPKSARVTASRMLTNANIQHYLQSLRSNRSERTKITQDKVLNEIAKIAFSNMSDVADWDESGVTLKDSLNISCDAHSAVESVSESNSSTSSSIRIKMHSKTKALELLAKHVGLFEDDQGDSGEDRRKNSAKRIFDLARNVRKKRS